MRYISFIMMYMIISTIVSADSGHKCQQTDAFVDTTSESEFRLVCHAAKKASVFLEQHGFTVTHRLNISVVDEISVPYSDGVFGQFSTISKKIKILSLSSCLKGKESKSAFGKKMSETLHMSFIIHEIAHAIANENFSDETSSIIGHEYIAYTVQLATMPSRLRQSIIDSYDIGAFDSEYEINEIYLGISPEYFAIKAYKHLIKPENGRQFYYRILSGKFQPVVDLY